MFISVSKFSFLPSNNIENIENKDEKNIENKDEKKGFDLPCSPEPLGQRFQPLRRARRAYLRNREETKPADIWRQKLFNASAYAHLPNLTGFIRNFLIADLIEDCVTSKQKPKLKSLETLEQYYCNPLIREYALLMAGHGYRFNQEVVDFLTDLASKKEAVPRIKVAVALFNVFFAEAGPITEDILEACNTQFVEDWRRSGKAGPQRNYYISFLARKFGINPEARELPLIFSILACESVNNNFLLCCDVMKAMTSSLQSTNTFPILNVLTKIFEGFATQSIETISRGLDDFHKCMYDDFSEYLLTCGFEIETAKGITHIQFAHKSKELKGDKAKAKEAKGSSVTAVTREDAVNYFINALTEEGINQAIICFIINTFHLRGYSTFFVPQSSLSEDLSKYRVEASLAPVRFVLDEKQQLTSVKQQRHYTLIPNTPTRLLYRDGPTLPARVLYNMAEQTVQLNIPPDQETKNEPFIVKPKSELQPYIIPFIHGQDYANNVSITYQTHSDMGDIQLPGGPGGIVTQTIKAPHSLLAGLHNFWNVHWKAILMGSAFMLLIAVVILTVCFLTPAVGVAIPFVAWILSQSAPILSLLSLATFSIGGLLTSLLVLIVGKPIMTEPSLKLQPVGSPKSKIIKQITAIDFIPERFLWQIHQKLFKDTNSNDSSFKINFALIAEKMKKVDVEVLVEIYLALPVSDVSGAGTLTQVEFKKIIELAYQRPGWFFVFNSRVEQETRKIEQARQDAERREREQKTQQKTQQREAKQLEEQKRQQQQEEQKKQQKEREQQIQSNLKQVVRLINEEGKAVTLERAEQEATTTIEQASIEKLATIYNTLPEKDEIKDQKVVLGVHTFIGIIRELDPKRVVEIEGCALKMSMEAVLKAESDKASRRETHEDFKLQREKILEILSKMFDQKQAADNSKDTDKQKDGSKEQKDVDKNQKDASKEQREKTLEILSEMFDQKQAADNSKDTDKQKDASKDVSKDQKDVDKNQKDVSKDQKDVSKDASKDQKKGDVKGEQTQLKKDESDQSKQKEIQALQLKKLQETWLGRSLLPSEQKQFLEEAEQYFKIQSKIAAEIKEELDKEFALKFALHHTKMADAKALTQELETELVKADQRVGDRRCLEEDPKEVKGLERIIDIGARKREVVNLKAKLSDYEKQQLAMVSDEKKTEEREKLKNEISVLKALISTGNALIELEQPFVKLREYQSNKARGSQTVKDWTLYQRVLSAVLRLEGTLAENKIERDQRKPRERDLKIEILTACLAEEGGADYEPNIKALLLKELTWLKEDARLEEAEEVDTGLLKRNLRLLKNSLPGIHTSLRLPFISDKNELTSPQFLVYASQYADQGIAKTIDQKQKMEKLLASMEKLLIEEKEQKEYSTLLKKPLTPLQKKVSNQLAFTSELTPLQEKVSNQLAFISKETFSEIIFSLPGSATGDVLTRTKFVELAVKYWPNFQAKAETWAKLNGLLIDAMQLEEQKAAKPELFRAAYGHMIRALEMEADEKEKTMDIDKNLMQTCISQLSKEQLAAIYTQLPLDSRSGKDFYIDSTPEDAILSKQKFIEIIGSFDPQKASFLRDSVPDFLSDEQVLVQLAEFQ